MLLGGIRSVSLMVAGLVLGLASGCSMAQVPAYPAKSIQLVIGYPPGGGADTLARLIAKGIAEATGQSAIVENRPGASALLAMEKVAKAAPDGYTLLVMASSSIMAQALNPRLPIDIERDLAPLSTVAIQPIVLAVNSSLGVEGIREFIALAKARPGSLNYGSSGIGGASHIAGELFNVMADVKLFHVPFKGGGQSVTAAAAGDIQSVFTSITSAKALMDAGKLKPLAVTSRTKSVLLPAVPSLNETALPGYESVVWYSVMGPAALGSALSAAINALMARVVNDPRMKQPFFNEGLEPLSSAIQELRSMIRAELVQGARIIKVAGLKPE